MRSGRRPADPGPGLVAVPAGFTAQTAAVSVRGPVPAGTRTRGGRLFAGLAGFDPTRKTRRGGSSSCAASTGRGWPRAPRSWPWSTWPTRWPGPVASPWPSAWNVWPGSWPIPWHLAVGCCSSNPDPARLALSRRHAPGLVEMGLGLLAPAPMTAMSLAEGGPGLVPFHHFAGRCAALAGQAVRPGGTRQGASQRVVFAGARRRGGGRA